MRWGRVERDTKQALVEWTDLVAAFLIPLDPETSALKRIWTPIGYLLSVLVSGVALTILGFLTLVAAEMVGVNLVPPSLPGLAAEIVFLLALGCLTAVVIASVSPVYDEWTDWRWEVRRLRNARRDGNVIRYLEPAEAQHLRDLEEAEYHRRQRDQS